MPFSVRTPTQIAQRAWAAIRAELPGTDAMPRENNLAVMAKVIGLALHDVELRAAWIYKQIFATTADSAHLDRHAYEEGLVRRSAARAEGIVTMQSDQSVSYPAGIGFIIGDQFYTSIASATAGTGPAGQRVAVSITVRAEDAGTAGNQVAGTTVTIADPFTWTTLNSVGVVASGGIGGGAARETDEQLRARILDRRRRPPQGGAYSDYEQWAMEVPGVTAAWATRTVNAPGEVTVWVLFAGRVNGIPTSGDIDIVEAMFDERRRIATKVNVQAPAAVPVDITITGLVPDTTEVRAAVSTALVNLFRPSAAGMPPTEQGRMRPGEPLTSFVLSRSWISEVISTAVGEGRHILTTPSADLTFTGGQLPVLGTVTFA